MATTKLKISDFFMKNTCYINSLICIDTRKNTEQWTDMNCVLINLMHPNKLAY